ncbi:HNH endonuclease signature motif containing protein [Cumulibacter soli]|uniref:HNH endonuclease signature motif containing protein n=1 Tax=Cumulibacter soli TaxID=2546344 RepID=UPI001068C698|nr:HNH endonuclease signature motif containing protein [Cumulibacter soli]
MTAAMCSDTRAGGTPLTPRGSREDDRLRFVPSDARAAAAAGVTGPLRVAEAFSVELADALEHLQLGMDALLEIGNRGDFAALDPSCLVGLAREFEAHRSRGVLFDSRVIEAASEDPAFPDYAGSKSIPKGLAQLLRISTTEANARQRRAEKLLPRNGFSQGEIPPDLPVLAGAVEGGAVSTEQLDVVLATMKRIDTIPELDASLREQAESMMVGFTASLTPAHLKIAGEDIDATLLPDGRGPEPRLTQARRTLRISRQRYDGLYQLSGFLTAETKARLDAVLSPLSAPKPDQSGTKDDRTADQRRHDGLFDALGLLLDGNGVPASGGTAATVHLVVDVDTVMDALGLTPTGAQGDASDWASEDHPDGVGRDSRGPRDNGSRYVGRVAGGDRITLREFRRLADEALLIPVWASKISGVVAYGRSKRIASAGQTHALVARDGGCSHPGCDVPPDWCQRHHVREWWRGGATDVSNLTLLCGAHHRELDSSGWRIDMRNGLPWWIPPPWIDPERKPVINPRIRIPDPAEIEDVARRARDAREAAVGLVDADRDSDDGDGLDPAEELIGLLAEHIPNPRQRDRFHQELADLLDSYKDSLPIGSVA